MNLADARASLADRGWVVLDLPNPSPVYVIRDQLLEWLRERLPALASLGDYHRYAGGDDAHFSLLHDLSRVYWEQDLGRTIIADNLDLFRALIGDDLHIQRYPYLRVVRPAKTGDAVPLHRDTYYGASAAELSVLVPFTDMDERCALRVISGSHHAPDSDYPYTQTVSPDVVKHSPKHELGFAYAPRVLDPALVERAEPVPVRVGQVLLFPLSLVHGGGIDSGHGTRFSSDIRLVNSFAPVAMERGVRKGYFVPLCGSAA